MSDEFRRKLKLIKRRDINRVYGWGTWIRTRINGVRVLYSYQTSIQLHHTPLRSDSRAARGRRPTLRGCDLVTHALAVVAKSACETVDQFLPSAALDIGDSRWR